MIRLSTARHVSTYQIVIVVLQDTRTWKAYFGDQWTDWWLVWRSCTSVTGGRWNASTEQWERSTSKYLQLLNNVWLPHDSLTHELNFLDSWDKNRLAPKQAFVFRNYLLSTGDESCKWFVRVYLSRKSYILVLLVRLSDVNPIQSLPAGVLHQRTPTSSTWPGGECHLR